MDEVPACSSAASPSATLRSRCLRRARARDRGPHGQGGDGGAAARPEVTGAAAARAAGTRVLAHEFMRVDVAAGFPHMPAALEEGLCGLGSYVHLLSCLHEPPDDGAAVLERDEAALRAEFRSRRRTRTRTTAAAACMRSLRGREIHPLLTT